MSQEKRCSKCGQDRPATEFRASKSAKDGLFAWCRECCRAYDKERGEKRYKRRKRGRPPREVVDGRTRCGRCERWLPVGAFGKDRRTASGMRNNCRACQRAGDQQRYKKDPEARKTSVQRWREANPEAWRTYKQGYEKHRQSADLAYRLVARLRSRLANAVRLGTKHPEKARRAVSAVRDLGCTVEELMKLLEARFKPGMTWENYGEWHVDHIQPLASFDLLDPEQCRLACHYTNLQPLWAVENLSKGARTD